MTDTSMPFLKETRTGIELDLHVQPRARKPEVAGLHGQALKIKVSAPPADGAANAAVLDLIAELFQVPRNRVQLIAGAASRSKRVHVDGLSLAGATARLEEVLK
jgi:uncharacterized protein